MTCNVLISLFLRFKIKMGAGLIILHNFFKVIKNGNSQALLSLKILKNLHKLFR